MSATLSHGKDRKTDQLSAADRTLFSSPHFSRTVHIFCFFSMCLKRLVTDKKRNGAHAWTRVRHDIRSSSKYRVVVGDPLVLIVEAKIEKSKTWWGWIVRINRKGYRYQGDVISRFIFITLKVVELFDWNFSYANIFSDHRISSSNLYRWKFVSNTITWISNLCCILLEKI